MTKHHTSALGALLEGDAAYSVLSFKIMGSSRSALVAGVGQLGLTSDPVPRYVQVDF
ncbi:hypothetical protein [Paenibacillus uliginis]|uniref:hypothetical protein n=1 Tax=Paenibacillus uliginis TaxID=683737 RepID=UPI001AD84142|nr:hypothetical protein [Paenibacillus uliginis]